MAITVADSPPGMVVVVAAPEPVPQAAKQAVAARRKERIRGRYRTDVSNQQDSAEEGPMPQATIDGVQHYYREAGTGPTAVFIHGYPLDHRVWLDQLAATSTLRRAIAPDLRGHGRTESSGDSILTMEGLADDIAALLAAVGADRADVVGLSMGGYVALALWESHPHVVRTLTLVDTRAGADSPEARAGRDATATRIVERGTTALADELLPVLLGPNATMQARARLRTMIEATPYETAVAALAGMRDRKDRSALLETISVPVMVVTGADDRLIPPEQARLLASAIPGARLEIVAGAGHLPPIEAPEAVSGLLAGFWSAAT
jgi:pimeloyl-ACP methyl ester carboxylesterase